MPLRSVRIHLAYPVLQQALYSDDALARSRHHAPDSKDALVRDILNRHEAAIEEDRKRFGGVQACHALGQIHHVVVSNRLQINRLIETNNNPMENRHQMAGISLGLVVRKPANIGPARA